MTGRMLCAGALLTGLVLVLWLLPASHGQAVTLNAGTTGQVTPFSVYFADGESTQDIGTSYLPSCTALNNPGQLVTLEKEDESLRISQEGPIASSTVLEWDTTAHPTLTAAYNGTYACRNNASTSAAMYHLHVVQRLNVTPQPSTLVVNNTGLKYSIMASVSGVFPISINWTSSVPLATQEAGLTTFSFLSNDSGIRIDVPFTVTLTAEYKPAIPCAGFTTGSGYMLTQSVIDNCNAAAMPSQGTTTITVRPTCPPLPISQHIPTINRIDRHPINATVNVICIDGYFNATPASIQCLASGNWSAQPACIPEDECMTGNHNCSDNCTDITPGFMCSCADGTPGCFVTPSPSPSPTPSPTPAAPSAAATSGSVSDMITSMSAVTPAATSMSTHGAVTGVTADTSTVASSALDTGAIAGIAVGGAILMALIAGLIIYFAKKRDSVRKNVHDGHGSGDDDEIMLRNRGKSPEKSADGGVRAIDTKDLGNLPPTGQSDQDHSNLPPPPPQESAEGEYDAIVRTEHGKVQLSGNDGQDTYDHITLPNSAAAARPPSPTVAITTMAFTSVTVESVETTNDRANMQPINPDVNYSFVDPTKKRRE